MDLVLGIVLGAVGTQAINIMLGIGSYLYISRVHENEVNEYVEEIARLGNKEAVNDVEERNGRLKPICKVDEETEHFDHTIKKLTPSLQSK